MLNKRKTKGIWFGQLIKDLGRRTFCNLTWTGKAVKCLGIYIGHNENEWYKLNWTKKVDRPTYTIDNMIRHLKNPNFSYIRQSKDNKTILTL